MVSQVILKTKSQLEAMREAGRISAQALQAAGRAVEPGVTTEEINREAERFIRSKGAVPTFLHYEGFPATACVSVNEEIIHGIPGKRKIREGDIVSIDVGAKIGGYQGDNAATFPAGRVGERAQKLMDATRGGLAAGIRQAVPGNRLGDIGYAVQHFVEQLGYSVVREYVGHGIGEEMHEPPDVPNYGRPGHGRRLCAGMTIAIEPMVNEGTAEIKVMPNGWTVVTRDGLLSAHFENTIAITDNGPVILTQP